MTLVLLHGLGLTSNIWDPLIAILDGDVVALDLPGHGQCIDKDFSWEGVWTSLIQSLGTENANSCTLVLHSFAAAILPEIVKSGLIFKKVIFLEGILHSDDAVWTKDLPEMKNDAFQQWLVRFRSVSEMALRSQLVKRHSTREISLWSEGFRSANGDALRIMASNLVDRLHTDAIEKSLNSAKFPSIYIRGEKSRLGLVGRDFISSLGIIIAEVPESGHFPMLDNPFVLKQQLLEG